ncbi:MAG: hypothetical protein CMJ58_10140 [Planctomycetaceae bacterium]|nr:hypothetical protein [Planctomycetaceae bacterium]
MGDVRLGVIVMPLFQAFLLYSQIHSDVALDAWWRAIYRRDHPDYRARIRWNAIALAWLIIFSGLVIGIGGPIPAQ